MSGGGENKKRKCPEGEGDAGFLNLALSLSPSVSASLPAFAAPPPPLTVTVAAPAPPAHHRNYAGPAGSKPPRARRSTAEREGGGGGEIEPPFPWATNKRATVHSLSVLAARQIHKISGAVQCKKCDVKYHMEFDLREKFSQIGAFIAANKDDMRERAPAFWINPMLPKCWHCHDENCVKPVIPEDKDAINWLFLLLGQLLGCCTLDQLKYFCKHTENHRTGAKDRVLYLTYLGVCKQLDPSGPFGRKN